MVFKIRTSKNTMNYFEEISSSENLQPFILSKLAISMSLRNPNPLSEQDFHTDVNGLELNRQTITGEFDDLFKCLVEMREEKHISDDEYFQRYLRAHLNRGAKMIYSEYKYNKDFLLSLLTQKEGL